MSPLLCQMTRKFMPSKDLTDGPQRDADLKTKAQTKDKCVKFCVCVCAHTCVHMQTILC